MIQSLKSYKEFVTSSKLLPLNYCKIEICDHRDFIINNQVEASIYQTKKMHVSLFYKNISKFLVLFMLTLLFSNKAEAQLRKSFSNEKEWRWSYKVSTLENKKNYLQAALYMDSVLSITNSPDPFLYKDAAEAFFYAKRSDGLLTILELARRDSFCGVWEEKYLSLLPKISEQQKLSCLSEKIKNFALSNELVTMLVQDQDCRGIVPLSFINTLKKHGYRFNIDPVYCMEKGIEYIDSLHVKRVKEIIDSTGFYSIEELGKCGIVAINTIIIHSWDIDLQYQCLPIFQRLYEEGVTDAQSFIILSDTLELYKSGKTHYGTQAYVDEGGETIFDPIINEAEVNDRRMKLGVMPLDVYKASLR